MGRKHSRRPRAYRPRGGRNGFRHAKSLGQNFLTDGEIVRNIAYGSGADSDTLVLEIGPGEGVLTDELASVAGRVVAVEIDERLIPVLRTRFALDDNVEIVHGDIMNTDVAALIQREMDEHGLGRAAVVGNLPYYITTPIIMMLITSGSRASSMTVMMQKEVGERLLAEPGTKKAGAITYAVHYRCEVSKVCDVGKESFFPEPKVDSMVLRLDMRDRPPVEVEDEDRFFRCIRAGFSMRRKTLLNSLSSLEGVGKDEVRAALEEAGIDPSRRAESLSMAEFAALSDILQEA